jgi:cathepsin E
MVTFLVTVLAPFVVLATRVVANPLLFRDSSIPISLSITKQIDSNGKFNPVRTDRRRIKGLSQLDTSHLPSDDTSDGLPLDNTVANYLASIGVGNPPTNCKSCRFNVLSSMVFYMIPILDSLIVDTGSANTWVGAFAPYAKTNTSVNTSETVVSAMSCPDRWTSSNQKPMDQGTEYSPGRFFIGEFDFYL